MITYKSRNLRKVIACSAIRHCLPELNGLRSVAQIAMPGGMAESGQTMNGQLRDWVLGIGPSFQVALVNGTLAGVYLTSEGRHPLYDFLRHNSLELACLDFLKTALDCGATADPRTELMLQTGAVLLTHALEESYKLNLIPKLIMCTLDSKEIIHGLSRVAIDTSMHQILDHGKTAALNSILPVHFVMGLVDIVLDYVVFNLLEVGNARIFRMLAIDE